MEHMEHKTCEDCGKRIKIDRIIIKSTPDGNCYYCRMCNDYSIYLDNKLDEMLKLNGITMKSILKEVKLMESDT